MSSTLPTKTLDGTDENAASGALIRNGLLKSGFTDTVDAPLVDGGLTSTEAFSYKFSFGRSPTAFTVYVDDQSLGSTSGDFTFKSPVFDAVSGKWAYDFTLVADDANNNGVPDVTEDGTADFALQFAAPAAGTPVHYWIVFA